MRTWLKRLVKELAKTAPMNNGQALEAHIGPRI